MTQEKRQTVIIDYQEVHLAKLLITNDKAIYESYKQAGNVGLLFEPEVREKLIKIGAMDIDIARKQVG